MSETRFWFIRHALVDENSRGMLYGIMDVPICENTLRDQAPMYQTLARRLPRPAVWRVTPLSRTRRTAEAIFAHGYPRMDLDEEPALIEQSLGDWQGLPHAELPPKLTLTKHPFWPLAGHERPPNGESMAEVVTRAGARLEAMAHEFRRRDVVVVSHGGTIRAVVAHALGVDPDHALHLSIENLSLTRLERNSAGWRVLCVNELPGY